GGRGVGGGRVGGGGRGKGTAAGAPRGPAGVAGRAAMRTVLSSASREAVIGPGEPFCIIGERINPTGRKIFQQQLRDGDLSRVETDVADQVTGGAMVLDVNMGAPLVDEAELMVRAVKLIKGLTDMPLCLDSSLVDVLAAAITSSSCKAL